MQTNAATDIQQVSAIFWDELVDASDESSLLFYFIGPEPLINEIFSLRRFCQQGRIVVRFHTRLAHTVQGRLDRNIWTPWLLARGGHLDSGVAVIHTHSVAFISGVLRLNL